MLRSQRPAWIESLIRNQILARAPIEAFAQLTPHLTRTTLKPRTILQERHRRVEQVYFLESGIASIFAWTQQDGPVQVGLVGRLGMVGVSAVLAMARSPHRTLMQTQGEAFALPASELTAVMDAHPRFRVQLLNYVHFLLIQNSQFALCNARHELRGPWVARWLLLDLLTAFDGQHYSDYPRPAVHDAGRAPRRHHRDAGGPGSGRRAQAGAR